MRVSLFCALGVTLLTFVLLPFRAGAVSPAIATSQACEDAYHDVASIEAFHWITDLLDRRGIRYQVTGGFAARSYGAERPLADIDLDVAEKDIQKILPEVAKYSKLGLQNYEDAEWKLPLLTLNYKGQEIDLAGAFTKRIFDRNTRKWTTVRTDYLNSEDKVIHGKRVAVIPRSELVRYKNMLGRDVDIADIFAVSEGARPKFIPKTGDPSLIDVAEARRDPVRIGSPSVGKDAATVAILSDVEGPQGGRLFIVEKTGDHWLSLYEVEPEGFQGDPRWFPMTLGSKLGYFFGFRRLSPTQMTVPDGIEARNAIRHMNRVLKAQGDEEITLEFYRAPNDTEVTHEEYLRKLVELRALPIGLTVHDVAYHLLSILLPKKLVDHGIQITERTLGFVDFVRAAASQGDASAQRLVRDSVLDQLLAVRSHDVDLLGKVSETMLHQDPVETIVDSAIGRFAHHGSRADDYLKKVANSLPEKESQEMARWIQKYQATSPDRSKPLRISLSEIIGQMRRKQASLERAVEQFAK